MSSLNIFLFAKICKTDETQVSQTYKILSKIIDGGNASKTQLFITKTISDCKNLGSL